MKVSNSSLSTILHVSVWEWFFHSASFCIGFLFRNTEETVSSLLRYSIHLWDLKHPGTWENKGTYVYYTDFIMELAMLFLDLVHHIHMLVRRRVQVFLFMHLTFLLFFLCFFSEQLFGNIWLSMASLVIFMQLRYLFHEVQRRVRRHKNYLRVINNMEARSAHRFIVWLNVFFIKKFQPKFFIWLINQVFCNFLNADLLLLRPKSWRLMTMTAPSVGIPCWLHVNFPAGISSTSK